MAEKIGVLILGSGFGGLYAALQFEKRTIGVELTASLKAKAIPSMTASAYSR